MNNSSITKLINTKRKALFVLALFCLIVLFISSVQREIVISRLQARSVSSLFIETIRRLSTAGELIYAQRELDTISDKMKFVGEMKVNVVVADTLQELAKIDSGSDLLFFVEEKESIQALPFGFIRISVQIDLTKKIILAMLDAIVISSLLLVGVVAVLLYVEQKEKRFFVPLSDVLAWIGDLSIRGQINRDFDKESIQDYNLKIVYQKISDLVEENTNLQINDHLVMQAKQVAHDIRSPLSVLNLLAPSIVAGEEQKMLLSQAMNRINSIAEDLLKRNSGRDNELPLASVLQNVVFEKSNLNPEITFNLNIKNIEGNLYLSTVGTSSIERILSNLLNNSIESLEDSRGSVQIDLQIEKSFVHISISDNGKGIPAHVLSRLGQRGVSFGKDNEKFAGSGLGIYFAKDIIEKSGGKFHVASAVGSGTTVTLELPFKRS